MEIYHKNNLGCLVFSTALFQHCLAQAFADPTLKVLKATIDENAYSSETARVKYSEEDQRIIGLYRYEVSFERQGHIENQSILVKSKRSNKEYMSLITQILIQAGMKIDQAQLIDCLCQTALNHTDIKEINIYQLALKNSALASFLPQVYGTYVNEALDQYIVLEGYLSNAYLIHDYQDLSYWTFPKMQQALEELSRFHALFFNQYQPLVDSLQLGEITSTSHSLKLKPLWEACIANLKGDINSIFSKAEYQAHLHLIDTIAEWHPKIDAMPKTLIYNDLQIRNIAMRQDKGLCLFDWEIATIHLPQRDTVEFLCYLMQEYMTDQDLLELLEASRLAFIEAAQIDINSHDWLAGCLYALYDYQIDRLALQLNLHKVINRVDIVRVYHAAQRLVDIIKNKI